MGKRGSPFAQKCKRYRDFVICGPRGAIFTCALLRTDVPLLPMSRLLQILIAIFLPPLSVFLQRGLGAQFALNIVLTLMFEVPGAIHALWLLLSGSGSGRGGSRR